MPLDICHMHCYDTMTISIACLGSAVPIASHMLVGNRQGDLDKSEIQPETFFETQVGSG